jgi:hypothetical protein
MLWHTLGAVTELSTGIWHTKLAPADVRRLGEGKTQCNGKSVIGIGHAEFDTKLSRLLLDPAETAILNIGTSDDVLIVDMGAANTLAVSPATERPPVHPSPSSHGDKAFIAASEQHLGPTVTTLAKTLLATVRERYPGELHEGKARKWVNKPGNFMALTIQTRHRAYAVFVVGEPRQFKDAASLDIKTDRGPYCWFKLERPQQLEDAIRVVLASARMREGY